MKETIKLGIMIVGIILIINSLNGLDGIIKKILYYLNSKRMETYMHGSQSLLSIFLYAVGNLLKLIAGVIFILKPGIVSNRVFIATKIEEKEEIPFKTILSFLFCFGIYLMVVGSIDLISAIIHKIQLTKEAEHVAKFLRFDWLTGIIDIFKISIGYLLYKRFNYLLYSK